MVKLKNFPERFVCSSNGFAQKLVRFDVIRSGMNRRMDSEGLEALARRRFDICVDPKGILERDLIDDQKLSREIIAKLTTLLCIFMYSHFLGEIRLRDISIIKILNVKSF
jgi:hypothetical protein